MVAAAAVLAGVLPASLPRPPLADAPPGRLQSIDPAAERIRATIEAGEAQEPIAAFYRARDYRPIWISPGGVRRHARTVVALLERAEGEGLDPSNYRPQSLRAALRAARDGGPADLARAELALSTAYAAYVTDLHRPPPSAQLAFRDPGLSHTDVDPRGALEALAGAPDFARAMAAAQRMHPIYEALRRELAARRAEHGEADRMAALILANMGRARALPAEPGDRYLIVDIAAQRLLLYEAGRQVDTMRVIVGKATAQTPTMAGLIRYAKFRPYWNIPPDIVRHEIAPHVLREGPAYVARHEMEILSDWSSAARVIEASDVDWDAVASGAVTLRMRRLPGPRNAMGQVKLMLPNPLGIYLHDTPNKAAFKEASRTLSHGCVRLEDAHRLTGQLLGPVADAPPAGNDVRVDLDIPAPVYIVYLTLWPGEDGVEQRPDIYGRDGAAVAELGARNAAS